MRIQSRGLLPLACILSLSPALATAAVTVTQVSVSATNTVLPGVMFRDSQFGNGRPAVVLMHGCSGMWKDTPHQTDPVTGEPVLNGYLMKWGRKLAESGYVVLSVDSFSSRKPADKTVAQWQNQCGWSYDQGVNENTVRPGDAAAARAWLAALTWVDVSRVGLMGWSQGATAALVTLGSTYIDQNVLRPEAATRPFRTGVAFYPGCGFKYGASQWAYGGTSSSYWRPYSPVRIFHGTNDKLYDSQYDSATDTFPAYPSSLGGSPSRFPCEGRVYRALNNYGATADQVSIQAKSGAHHSYDFPHQSGFPSASCPAGLSADALAECQADGQALQFMNSRL